jgi:hypothetical protein
MNNQLWTVLIAAIALVVVLVALRDRLRNFTMRASHKGLDVKMQAQPRQPSVTPPGGVVIQGNRQVGWMHRIFAGRPAIISDNVLMGADSRIEARHDSVPEGTQLPEDVLPGSFPKKQNRGHADR